MDQGLVELFIDRKFEDEADWRTWCDRVAEAYQWYEDDGEGGVPTVELLP